jgi:rubredoxin
MPEDFFKRANNPETPDRKIKRVKTVTLDDITFDQQVSGTEPEDRAMLPDEWICPVCKNLNIGSKHCRTCSNSDYVI